ncbi:MAG: hypothetical protein HYW24_05320 [Candidatus Aenigmarchaeota archaeon]|nr:hypothetical protein [Candidatus Aenigmarchaeota archaeon]
MNLFNILKLNNFEIAYAVVFILSIIIGIGYGLIDKEYYKCCEDFIGVPEEGTSPMKIFSSNYLISMTELATAGLSSLYFNFKTFSVTSSYLNSQGELFVLPVIMIIGIFELVGSLCLALAGFSFVERMVKIKSRLKFAQLFLLGTALIFIGAVVEYLLITI